MLITIEYAFEKMANFREFQNIFFLSQQATGCLTDNRQNLHLIDKKNCQA